jgi:hypothetical protein
MAVRHTHVPCSEFVPDLTASAETATMMVRAAGRAGAYCIRANPERPGSFVLVLHTGVCLCACVRVCVCVCVCVCVRARCCFLCDPLKPSFWPLCLGVAVPKTS